MNWLRWGILVCKMLSQTSWITRHNCIWFREVFEALYDNQWGSSPMLDRVQDGEYAGQGSVWTAIDLRKSRVRQIGEEKAMHHHPMELAAHRCLFRVGPRYGRWAGSVNRLRWLRKVCVNIRALLCPGFPQQFLWKVSTDPIDVWGECANSLTGWFLEVATLRGWFQVVPISYRRRLNHRIVVCVTLKRLAPSSVFKLVCSTPIVLSLSTMVRP